MQTLVTNIQGYSIHDGPGIRTVVFLKGCGLECQWCSNPECISARPELGFIASLCAECGKCAGVCPNQALVCETGCPPRIDREHCTGCGACAKACSYHALKLYGQPMNVEAVFEAVAGDKMFYDASGGGVTISGGEPLLQPQFVSALLERCHLAGIHTAIETSGQAADTALLLVLKHTDYVLFDLKHQSPERHRGYTGQSNNLILSNARLVANSGVEFLFRMPLIPGINDDPQNISKTTDFLRGLGEKALRIELMPYHRLGKGKYDSLDKRYQMAELAAAEPQQVEQVQKTFEQLGIKCSISN